MNGVWPLLSKDMVTEEGAGFSAMLSNVSRRRRMKSVQRNQKI